jgi:Ca2+-binding RTX toxin-like protein
LYAAGLDGVLRAYSMRTGELIGSWTIGTELGGMDLSPDGSFLMIAEGAYVSAPGGISLTSYRFDLATQGVQTYSIISSDTEAGAFFDVAVLADKSVLLNRRFTGFSKVLDLETSQYSNGSVLSSYSIMSPVEDGHKVLIAEGNSSGGGLAIYEPDAGVTASSYTEGYNWGVQAISSQTGQVAQWIYNQGIRIYGPTLEHLTTLTQWRNGSVEGLTFDKDGQNLFILDDATDRILQVSTADWSVVQSIPVGFDVGRVSGQSATNLGSKLILDPSGSFFTVLTKTGLVAVANPAAPALVGTEGADSLDGFLFSDDIDGKAGDDHLSGFAGNDRLDGGTGDDTLVGGTGDDTLVGGTGDDTYIVDSRADVVTEKSGEGTDEVRTAVGSRTDYTALYALAGEVEKLTGTGLSDQGVSGNALDNIVTMGAGNDLVAADTGGKDIVDGGGGNDLLYFGAAWGAGDRAIGGEGDDTLALRGEYADAIVFDPDDLVGIERLTVYSGAASPEGVASKYNLTMADANVAAGERLIVNGRSLLANEALIFNGTAETNGRFTVQGGSGGDDVKGGGKGDHLAGNGGDDVLDGGGGNDTLIGGLGADTLIGGDGRDTFTFASAAESSGLGFDAIVGFDYRVDKMDLHSTVSGYAGTVLTGSLNADTFDQDLASAVNALLQPNSAMIYQPDEGEFAGAAFAVIDADGDGVYTAGNDYVFLLVEPILPDVPTTGFFA